MKSPIDYFTGLTDPRVDRTKDYLMEDIIFITIAAVICGAETWNDIEQYGKSKQSWLSQYLRLPNGISSHDIFNRFFSALDPDGFEGAFLSWIKDVSLLTEGEIVRIAAEIIDKEADYILAVKGNQGNPEGNAEETIRFTKSAEEWVEEDVGHGRIESRTCSVYRDLSFIENASMWNRGPSALRRTQVVIR
jgi:predicted transposase YbfD/YdcC